MTKEEIQAEFGDPDRIEARLEFHRRVIAEEEAARIVCDRVLIGPPRWWATAIRKEEGSMTAGMVTILIECAEKSFGRSPLESYELAQIARSIATRIEVDEYPYDYVYKIRGQALREEAFTLSCLGRLLEAAAVAARAAECLKQLPVPPPELARLDLVRSNIARNMGKFDEAVSHARRAADDFLAFGDREGWVKAQVYEAAALYESHDYRGALVLWESLGKYSHLVSAHDRAGHLHNLAICAAATGDFDEAARYFARAAEALDRLVLPVVAVKCRCGIGVALHSAGRHSEAAVVLEKVRREFEELGMEGDSAYAALFLAECLLVLGRHDEVAEISRMLIDRCARAGMVAGAMTALAFLRETIATGHLTPLHVKHVRDLFEDAQPGREQPFAPFPQPRGEA